MNEASLNFLGRDIATHEGHNFAKEVLFFMRDRLQHYQEQTGNYYNLEATPAEGASYRLALKDKEKYPEIMVANEGQFQDEAKAPYYTNSTHIPVDYTNDVFQLLDLQDELQVLYTGGTVVHVFVGEEINDTAGLSLLIKTICEKYKLPYFTITPTFSVCPNHGYLSGKVDTCAKCGAENEVYSRVVGYIRPVKQWNVGKKAEFGDRKLYEIMEKVNDLVPAFAETKPTESKCK